MQKYIARKFLLFSTEELWEMLTGQFELEFDNGETIVTTANECLYSSYAWDFHREYPNTPLLPEHHVQRVCNGKRLESGTHLEMFGRAMWATYDAYLPTIPPESEPDFRDMLSEKIYRQTNLLYNDAVVRLEEFVSSLDILDFINVVNHPVIKATNDALEPTQASIDNAYHTAMEVLNNDPLLNSNALALAVRSKMVNNNQVLQCVVARGYLTDTDSHLFKHPVLRGYVHGIRSFHDSLIETRSAAKSLLFSKSPLEQAEYFSRRMQLMTQTVQNLHYGDCGTTKYLMFHMRKPDLKRLHGKYYLCEDTKQLKAITPKCLHLVGKTLKIRSVIHCAHKDSIGVCSTCFGQLSYSIPRYTNLGQLCCSSLAQMITQKVLSIKHLDGSSVVRGIELHPDEEKYLRVSKANSYVFAPELADLPKVSLLIMPKDARNLPDIYQAENIEQLNITHVSELETIGLQTIGEKGMPNAPVVLDVGVDHRLASLTYPMLHYIKKQGWTFDEKGNYVIDLSGWDWTKPFLTLPMKHFNMSDYSQDIAVMLESSVKNLRERDTIVSPDSALINLYDLISDQMDVNLAVIEVVLYATMVVSTSGNNFTLPKPWSSYGLGVMEVTMASRSLAASMAYEGHRKTIFSPGSFIYRNRTDHPVDAIICPEILA